VDGTLARTTIVTPLVWMKRRFLPPPMRWLWPASLLVRGPWWLLLDRFSRRASNRAIYSNYRGIPADQTRKLAPDYYYDHIRPRIFEQAYEHLELFRSLNARVVLVTGGLDLFMKPMARALAADCIAPSLEERDGAFTGRLSTEPLSGERKAEAVRRHAAEHGIDLKKSYALGDAIADMEMLEVVGHPIAINPDKRLLKTAIKRGWRVEWWTR
jgi:alcohol-forming fatty acyl-CoA reductase